MNNRPMRCRGWLVLALGGLLASAAQAIAVAGPEAPSPPTARRVVVRPTVNDAAAVSLVEARVAAVDIAKQTLTLGGLTVAVDPGHLRVIAPDGRREQGLAAVRPGARIRFALERPTDPMSSAPRRITLIYIEQR